MNIFQCLTETTSLRCNNSSESIAFVKGTNRCFVATESYSVRTSVNVIYVSYRIKLVNILKSILTLLKGDLLQRRICRFRDTKFVEASRPPPPPLPGMATHKLLVKLPLGSPN